MMQNIVYYYIYKYLKSLIDGKTLAQLFTSEFQKTW